jgi:hypothetical protein
MTCGTLPEQGAANVQRRGRVTACPQQKQGGTTLYHRPGPLTSRGMCSLMGITAVHETAQSVLIDCWT